MSQISSFLKSMVKMNTRYVLLGSGFVVLISLISKVCFGSPISFYLSLLMFFCLSLLTLTQMLYPSDIGQSLKSYSVKYFESLPFPKAVTLTLIALTNFYIALPVILHALILCVESGTLSNSNIFIMVAEFAALISILTFLVFGLALFAGNAKSKNLDTLSMVVYLLKCAGAGGLLISASIAFETLMTLFKVSPMVLWINNLKLALSSLEYLFSFSSLALIILVAVLLFVGTIFAWNNHNFLYWTFKPVKRNIIEATALITSIIVLALFSVENKTNIFTGNDLTVAIYKQDKSLVSKLGKLTDFYDKESSFGVTPLMAALLVKDCDTFKFLKANDFKKHKAFFKTGHSLDGVNIMGLAAAMGCTQNLESLVGTEFKIDQAVHESGRTALHMAAQFCQPELAESLLRWGANPDEKDSEGNSPVFYSTRGECHAVNLLLKSYDADFRITNSKGERPKDWLPKNASPSSLYFYKKQANL